MREGEECPVNIGASVNQEKARPLLIHEMSMPQPQGKEKLLGRDLRAAKLEDLASASFWQDMLGAPVTVASYDRQLWEAAKATGFIAWTESLP
jgi:hypothetical protein